MCEEISKWGLFHKFLIKNVFCLNFKMFIMPKYFNIKKDQQKSVCVCVCIYTHTENMSATELHNLATHTLAVSLWIWPHCKQTLNEKSKSPIFTLITNCCIKLFSGRVAYVLPFKFVKICSVVCAKCYYLHCHISWLSGLLLPCLQLLQRESKMCHSISFPNQHTRTEHWLFS